MGMWTDDENEINEPQARVCIELVRNPGRYNRSFNIHTVLLLIIIMLSYSV